MKKLFTKRGFGHYEFKDSYGMDCSIQKSSSIKNKIWIGINDPKPQIMASRAGAYGIMTHESTGWVEFPIPDDVSLSTRMHLTKKQVRKLLFVLIKFAFLGRI